MDNEVGGNRFVVRRDIATGDEGRLRRFDQRSQGFYGKRLD
jgi:hypothetical protein